MSRALLITGLRTAPRSRVAGFIAAMSDAGVDIDIIACRGDTPFELVRGTYMLFAPQPRQPRQTTPMRQIKPLVRLITQDRNVDRLRRAVLRMPDLDDWVARADVICALDLPGIDVAWHLARRYPGKPAVLGVPAALRVLTQG